MTDSAPAPLSARHLALGTLSFAFAAWGLVAAFSPRFREAFHLSATETALLVAVPVLLGSLARLPVGMLADRFGGRTVFALLMLAVAVPVWLVPAAASYRQLFGRSQRERLRSSRMHHRCRPVPVRSSPVAIR